MFLLAKIFQLTLKIKTSSTILLTRLDLRMPGGSSIKQYIQCRTPLEAGGQASTHPTKVTQDDAET